MTFATVCILLASVGTDLDVVHLGDTRRIQVSVELSTEQAAQLKQSRISFDEGKKQLRLSIRDEDGSLGPAIFARYAVEKGRLVLSPRYQLARGVTYEAIASLSGNPEVRKRFRLPSAPTGKPPRVTAVYPSGDTLPANCLKFYLHFSQPMREGREIFDQVTIQDAEGNVVSDPWRRVELWNDDASRLTLWIHPGRIKQGLNVREALGPVLKPNHEYRLIVARAVRDAQDLPLASQFVKRFRTAKEDHRRPLPSKWQLSTPHLDTRQPLTLRFGKPLDRALLDRFVTVHGPHGRLKGGIAVAEHESLWQFTPEESWTDAKYHVHVDGRLEDVAGNTPLRVFDNDLLSKQGRAPMLRVVFQPAASP